MAETAPASQSNVAPALDFADALAKFAALRALEGPEINPVCKSLLLSHERKTPRALVFFHGYTNCPQQFRRLGAEFHRRGYNVLAPRQPYQGLLDRLSEDHAKLTAEDLIESTNAAIDIACGLGNEVIVSGLSCGGIMAAWAAQYRQDVALAVLASPVFGLGVLPPFMNGFGRGVMQSLPNRFVWWDPRIKAKIAGCPHGYPRWATHALAQMMRMGAIVRRDAVKTGPRAQRVLLITNANDLAVNNKMIYRLAEDWRRLAPEKVQTYEFAKDQGVVHDMIDPSQVDQRTDLVYPVWLDLIDGPASQAGQPA